MICNKPSRFLCVLFVSLIVALLLSCAAPQQGAKPTVVTDEEALREQARADSLRAVREKEIKIAKSTGQEYHKNKQYADAIPHLERVLELDPKNENTYYRLADCYLQLNELDKAQEVYQRAISADPENGHYYQYLGYILDKKGLHQEAIEAYERAVDLMPESVEAHLALANLYLGQQMDGPAIEEFSRVAELDSTRREVLVVLSKLYTKHDEKEALADTYERMLKLDSNDRVTMLELGKTYTELGKNQEAVLLLRKLTEMEQENVNACLYLGTALNNMDKCEEAITVFNRALALEPKNLRAMSDLAYSYSETGNHTKAWNMLKKVAQLDSEYAYRFVVQGEIYENEAEPFIKADGTVKWDGKLKYEKAVGEYKKALKDPEWGQYARHKIEYLTPFLPTEEDRFFHGKKGQ
ncbi:MAG: hypothetical protein AMJ92_04830 [candidate division Zixibacteria bacterium SM23_81]|nr:MAG: hypothetical protein AMJ92_04830 [candidate division Zixibacteria bacterium SM23_81]